MESTPTVTPIPIPKDWVTAVVLCKYERPTTEYEIRTISVKDFQGPYKELFGDLDSVNGTMVVVSSRDVWDAIEKGDRVRITKDPAGIGPPLTMVVVGKA